MPPFRWRFYDPVTAQDQEFFINPNKGGSPPRRKNVIYQSTSAPDGKTLVFEGHDETQQLEWSGVVLEQNQYDLYVEWFGKRRQIRLTDDLGRVMWIYITAFEPNRVYSSSHPWRHEISVKATILDWA